MEHSLAVSMVSALLGSLSGAGLGLGCVFLYYKFKGE